MVKFVSDTCSAFLAHWQALPRQGLMPHTRTFFDHPPVQLMPFVFVHDIMPEGLLVRYMGSGLVERWRHDLTGEYFAVQMGPDAARRVRERAENAWAHPSGIRQMGRLVTSASRKIHFESVLLPLAVDPDRPRRVCAFSQALEAMEHREHSEAFSATGEVEWIDLGAGLPAKAP
jgi:hypothetical protein